MANKHLLFRAAAREKILRGASALTDAVRVTLGPKSRCVLIEKKYGRPVVCNDGVTIAKEVDLQDPEENLGARMLRERSVPVMRSATAPARLPSWRMPYTPRACATWRPAPVPST